MALVVNYVTRSVYDVAPWISLVIGAALMVVGLLMLRGFDPTVRLPRLDRGGRTGGVGSMTLFGISYAVASIGCELPIFLIAMTGAFGKNLASGLVYFVFFGLGFAAIIVSLSITLAMARQSLVQSAATRSAVREPHRGGTYGARRRLRRLVRVARDPRGPE